MKISPLKVFLFFLALSILVAISPILLLIILDMIGYLDATSREAGALSFLMMITVPLGGVILVPTLLGGAIYLIRQVLKR